MFTKNKQDVILWILRGISLKQSTHPLIVRRMIYFVEQANLGCGAIWRITLANIQFRR